MQNDGVSDQSKRIVFTQADINRLSLLWEKQRQRPPTQPELGGLIEQQVREQVFYREALAMGLDQNDAIVRRRLAQKVEFISSDIAAQVEPSETELADYLASHSGKFEIPARISFIQIYLSAERRGKQTEKDAHRLLSELRQPASKVDIHTAGDPFMPGQQHKQLSESGVSRLFGQDIARELFTLPTGSWQEPVWSGYGLHLVRIDSKTPAHRPELAVVRDKVRAEWMDQQRRALDKAFYQGLRQHYEIIIESDNRAGSSQKNTTASAR